MTLKNYQNCYVRFNAPFTTEIEISSEGFLDQSIPVTFAQNSRIKAAGVWEQRGYDKIFYINLCHGVCIARVPQNVFRIEEDLA